LGGLAMLRAARSLRRIGQLIHARCDAASRKTLAPAAGTHTPTIRGRYIRLFFLLGRARAHKSPTEIGQFILATRSDPDLYFRLAAKQGFLIADLKNSG
jgi:hypothetical protein